MIEIRKTSITLDEQELIELERIVTDLDEEAALNFVKRCVYGKIEHTQKGRLKSHLDGNSNPVDKFIK